MNFSRTISPLIPITALAFAILHLAFEHFNGGVKTHHFLARADMPGFSNWLGLVILPLLGTILAMRVASLAKPHENSPLPRSIAIPFAGALLYGGALAASFLLGAPKLSYAALIGLFFCALALPVYRAEYILGYVIGMTITFGSVIPLLFAIVFATISFIVRSAAKAVISAIRNKRT